MNYKFPIIKHMTDVLPAIAGRDEFIVAERDGYTVINYNVGFEDTFTIDENDTMENYGVMIPKGIMRRECRGIIFDKAGKIMSRPFHKFFNVGERDETQINMLDFNKSHVIMEKIDGSMIRPLFIDGEFRMGTKMGLTDVADLAEKFLHKVDDRDELHHAILHWMIAGKTPLFEFVSPENRIVLKYDTENLVLLAVRDNITGIYDYHRTNEWSLGTVPTYGRVNGNFDEYIARQRGLEGREGDIIRFADGHMVKIKNDWYVRIHKVKDQIRSDRHILALVLAGQIDDVLPHLDETDYAYVKAYEAEFHSKFRDKLQFLQANAEALVKLADGNRKKLAIELLPESIMTHADYPMVFKFADGANMNEIAMTFVKSKLGNTAKYNDLMAWLDTKGN